MSEEKTSMVEILEGLLKQAKEQETADKQSKGTCSTVDRIIKAMEKAATDDGPIRIVVLDKGFVYVGKLRCGIDSLIIKKAMCIRRWGTTKGLGELTAGPLANTVLDPTGTVRAPMSSLVLVVDVEEDKWAPKMN